ncbi:MAG: efflux transporter, family, subunit [Pedosphaera sp.]|nr:efflux transporter, family, subunit [Pedosphaera sp.]
MKIIPKNKAGFGWLTWLVIIVIVAGLAGAGIWVWQRQDNKEPEYRTAPVSRGDLTQLVTATGQLNPMTNVQVGSQISGIISKLHVDFNSPVTNGQLIAQIDPATYKAAVTQAQGDLANAQSVKELAQVEANRAEELFKNKLISQSEHDKAVATLHQAEASITIKQAQLERANVDLNRTTIYAPIDGIVISRNVDVGQTVAASLSAPTLYIIANDLKQMQIDAVVSEADIGGVETNQNVNFIVDAFPYRTFHGAVLQVRNSPITNQNVISYDTVIGVDNKDQKLKPGMTANVSVIVAQRNNAFKIPNGALRFKPPEAEAKKPSEPTGSATNAAAVVPGAAPSESGSGQSRPGGRGEGRSGGGGNRPGGSRPKGERPNSNRTVYVLAEKEGGKGQMPKPVQIKTGISDGISTEVLEGLKEGDVVIVGQNVSSSAPAQSGTANPFGGGGGMRRF